MRNFTIKNEAILINETCDVNIARYDSILNYELKFKNATLTFSKNEVTGELSEMIITVGENAFNLKRPPSKELMEKLENATLRYNQYRSGAAVAAHLVRKMNMMQKEAIDNTKKKLSEKKSGEQFSFFDDIDIAE